MYRLKEPPPQLRPLAPQGLRLPSPEVVAQHKRKMPQCQLQRLKLYSEIPDVEADKLQSLMAVHFSAFKKAWGTDEIVLLKHHCAMHLVQQFNY